MTDLSINDGALANWSAPQCPFVIEYSRRALDDIRLAVVDAFFSPPRGGVEIGGILLGRFESERLQILDSVPIECEHAFGPVFTLSPADQVRLGELLGRSYPGDLKPVGWYHSHTRSDLALCEADVDIHNRYFPERWQVALVLRPSTLQPTQAGFFFREPDGAIQNERSYHEFVVEALPVQQLPQSLPAALPGPTREIESDAVVLTLASSKPQPHHDQPEAHLPEPDAHADITEPEQVEMHESHRAEWHEQEREPLHESHRAEWHEHEGEPVHEPVRAEWPERQRIELPERERLEMPEPEEAPQRPWIGIAAGLAVGLVLGAIANQMRSHSQPETRVVPAPAVAARPADPTLRKRADELATQVVVLTQQNADLRRQSEQSGKQQTDVARLKADLAKAQADLAKQQADASKAQADTSKAQADTSKAQTELRQQRDDLAKQTAKLKADLAAQTARAQSVQQQLDDLRRQQQRRRLNIQSSDPQP
ncbi:MAG TPA: hypothetical protein VGF16_13035 [Bryobacteraceae bacterium]